MVRGVAAMLVAPARTQSPVLGLERKPPGHGLQARAGIAEPIHKRHVWLCLALQCALHFSTTQAAFISLVVYMLLSSISAMYLFSI